MTHPGNISFATILIVIIIFQHLVIGFPSSRCFEYIPFRIWSNFQCRLIVILLTYCLHRFNILSHACKLTICTLCPLIRSIIIVHLIFNKLKDIILNSRRDKFLFGNFNQRYPGPCSYLAILTIQSFNKVALICVRFGLSNLSNSLAS